VVSIKNAPALRCRGEEVVGARCHELPIPNSKFPLPIYIQLRIYNRHFLISNSHFNPHSQNDGVTLTAESFGTNLLSFQVNPGWAITASRVCCVDYSNRAPEVRPPVPPVGPSLEVP
jgi:hypothetical protein